VQEEALVQAWALAVVVEERALGDQELLRLVGLRAVREEEQDVVEAVACHLRLQLWYRNIPLRF
jgi:hypothetical protein